MTDIGLMGSVSIVCVAALLWQIIRNSFAQWRLEFQRAQQPQLELAKVKADFLAALAEDRARISELEKSLRTEQLRKLGR